MLQPACSPGALHPGAFHLMSCPLSRGSVSFDTIISCLLSLSYYLLFFRRAQNLSNEKNSVYRRFKIIFASPSLFLALYCIIIQLPHFGLMGLSAPYRPAHQRAPQRTHDLGTQPAAHARVTVKKVLAVCSAAATTPSPPSPLTKWLLHFFLLYLILFLS
eukprot:SAG11_NODE_10845_length_802_cov_0.992888_1_plen_160_part_00